MQIRTEIDRVGAIISSILSKLQAIKRKYTEAHNELDQLYPPNKFNSAESKRIRTKYTLSSEGLGKASGEILQIYNVYESTFIDNFIQLIHALKYKRFLDTHLKTTFANESTRLRTKEENGLNSVGNMHRASAAAVDFGYKPDKRIDTLPEVKKDALELLKSPTVLLNEEFVNSLYELTKPALQTKMLLSEKEKAIRFIIPQGNSATETGSSAAGSSAAHNGGQSKKRRSKTRKVRR